MASMPHLSQLQRDYKDQNVTIIGLTSEDAGNTLEKVQAMVEDKGDGMDYTVAWDVGRETNEAYMKASGQRGIPTSFLVDKTGNIAWIGHPGNVDIPLAFVVADKWDYEKGPAMMKEISAQKSAIYAASSADPARAYLLLGEFKREHPLAAKGLESLHFSIIARLPEHKAEALKLGQEIVNEAVAAKDTGSLNGFAWNLVDPEVDLENRFLDLALLAANKALELGGKDDGAILDTAARVHFWRGDIERALELQKRAVEHSEGAMKTALQAAVAEYEGALRNG